MCDCDENTTSGGFKLHQVENITITDSEDYNETCAYNFTVAQEETCCKLTKYLEVEGRFVICMVGLLFNSIAILLFFDNKLSSELFNRLLLCLMVTDNFYLLIGIAEAWINDISKPSFDQLFLYLFVVYPIRGITMCCIIYLTVILALQRYKCVTRPLKHQRRCTNTSTVSWIQVLKFAGPVFLFSVLFKLPEFFELLLALPTLTVMNS